jgi:hypothetical protein
LKSNKVLQRGKGTVFGKSKQSTDTLASLSTDYASKGSVRRLKSPPIDTKKNKIKLNPKLVCGLAPTKECFNFEECFQTILNMQAYFKLGDKTTQLAICYMDTIIRESIRHNGI